MRRITIDFAIPFIVAGAFAALTNFIGDKWIDKIEEKSNDVVYSDSIIGAAATDDVPVVSSIEEMMEEDCFTIHNYDSFIGIHDSAYYNGVIYDIVKLESGEYVLVDAYTNHIDYRHQKESKGSVSYDDYRVFPVGKVVHKEIPDELIEKFEKSGYYLTDTSFYVDMHGIFKYLSWDGWEQFPYLIRYCISPLVFIIVFIIVRYLMIASGLFSPLIPLRFLKKWKHFIVYYNVIYYDENIKKILDYRKQGKMEEAAKEFSILTNVSIEEAREAMKIWNDIYGEGILPMLEVK
ncbi:MAG: hypothetical protein IJA10_13955 [Lachnospiraceae bacterium]|nr:hypothetical protein [Lachnospiraceae bacterium]